MLVLKAVVLAAFIKLLFATDSPRFCAGVYTGLAALGAVLEIVTGDVHIAAAVLGVMLAGALAWGYFTALHRINPWTGAWWAVAIGGPILGGVVTAAIGRRTSWKGTFTMDVLSREVCRDDADAVVGILNPIIATTAFDNFTVVPR